MSHLSRNASAAVPSLHAAYSFMVVLMAFSISRQLGPIGDRLRAAMWFTIVFFGEHYVSDALIGIALAASSCGCAEGAATHLVRRAVPRADGLGAGRAETLHLTSARGVRPLPPRRDGPTCCRAPWWSSRRGA